MAYVADCADYARCCPEVGLAGSACTSGCYVVQVHKLDCSRHGILAHMDSYGYADLERQALRFRCLLRSTVLHLLVAGSYAARHDCPFVFHDEVHHICGHLELVNT